MPRQLACQCWPHLEQSITQEFPDDERPQGQLTKSLCEEEIDGGGGVCTEVGVEERTLSDLRSSLDVLGRLEGFLSVGESAPFLALGLTFDLLRGSGVCGMVRDRSKG